VAISIDAMVPALGVISRDLHIANPNHIQYIITCLFIGMSVGQLICGPFSDALGRKKILYFGIILFLIGSTICFFSTSLGPILIGRSIQGLGVAGPYVSVMSIVRDKYSGRDMAKIMSIIMMIFIMVPAIAPSLGQGIMLMFSWRFIFLLYIIYSIVITCWLYFRLEETLPQENRITLSLGKFADEFKQVVRNRHTVCYTICMGICFGSFLGYLNSSQQIFQDHFQAGKMFTVYFGLLALGFGVASLVNSRFVEKMGMRYLCIRAFVFIIAVSALFLVVNVVVQVSLWMFLLYAGAVFFSFGMLFGNLNALAMEPMGHIAGMASALIGSASSVISLVLGTIIGQMYNNSVVPLVCGFMVLGLLAFLTMLAAENKNAEFSTSL
jgi:DHA1 family bicyclomycin/chloramphenicol resistance-like MFS transporter